MTSINAAETILFRSSRRGSKWIILMLIVFGSVSHRSVGGQEQEPLKSDAEPTLVFDDYEELVEKRDSIQSGDAEARSEYERLIEKADRALEEQPVSVMQKRRVAPSGDPHDYLTLAPYWWPNPKTTDGLPYVRRDGRVNPTTRGDNVDYPQKDALFHRVGTLTMAGFYSGDHRYSRKAVQQLEVWFVDPKTRMNPNLNYAQGIPGINDGRCFGIIEWAGLGRLITSVQLLKISDQIPEDSYEAIRQWFAEYLDWLLDSEFGKLESDRQNNHGTWYDVQVVGLMLFFDRKGDARDWLETVTKDRIAQQIEPDGRQPLELARTKSLSYSKMNLSAFKTLGALGKQVGVDLMDYQTPDGRSIRAAESFLAPYLKGEKEWPYQQL